MRRREKSAVRSALVARLRERRLGLGYRQADVAAAAGVSAEAVCSWERGVHVPTLDKAEAWCLFLGVVVTGGSLEGLFPALVPCGTPGGMRRHQRRRERCPECWAAWSRYVTAYRAARKKSA